MIDFAGFMRIFTRARLAPMTLRKASRLGGHDPRRTRDAARAGAGVDAVPVARPVEHRRARAHAAHAAHRGRAVRDRVRHELSRTLVSLQVDGADDSRSELDRVRAALFGVGQQRRASRGSCAMCGWSIRCPAPRCRRSTATTPIPVDRLRLRKWNAQALTFEDAAWPDDLRQAARRARDALHRLPDAARPRSSEAPGTHREASMSLSLGDDNTLIAPVTLFEMPDGSPRSAEDLDPRLHDRAARSGDHPRHAPGRADHAAFPRRRCGSRLSRRRRQERRSVQRGLGIGAGHRSVGDRGARCDAGLHGSAAGSDVRVRAESARTIPPPPPPPPAPPPSAGRRAARRTAAIPAPDRGPSDGQHRGVDDRARNERRGGGGRVITRAGQFGGFEGRWVLMAKHRSGSLEAAVAGGADAQPDRQLEHPAAADGGRSG